MGRREGPTLAERSAQGGRAEPGRLPAEPGRLPAGPGRLPEPATAPARHCWVVDPPEASGKWPGLLSEWRRTAADRWQGRTVYAVTTGGRAVLVEAWVDADQLHEA